jgi:hypothetical protein
LNEPQRRELRALVDEAKRGELEAVRRNKRALRARQASEKEEAAASRVILAAQRTHDPLAVRLKVVGRLGETMYLISVGEGLACILDLGFGSPRLSDATDLHGLLARRPWSPFEGDGHSVLGIASQLVPAA